MTAAGGRMVLVGQPDCSQNLVLHGAHKHYCGKTILDSQGGLTDPAVDIPRYVELYLCGKLRLEQVVTDRFRLESVNEAVARVKSGRAGRVILEMT